MALQELQFEDYVIEEELGQCSGGTLFRAYRAAENGGGGRRDLLYRAFPELARDINAVDLVRTQLLRSAGVSHANLLGPFRCSYDQGSLVLTSDWKPAVRLSTLQNAISASGQRWPVSSALFLAAELAKALCHVHTQSAGEAAGGLVHGQVNPDNVFVTFDGQVKLLGLGMATAENAALLGQQGHRKDLANFASPEQAAGLEIDGRSDLFSLGTLLWGLVAGRPLFAASPREEWVRILSEKTPPPPTQANPDAPPELDNIAAKLLDRDRYLRYELGERVVLDMTAVLKFRFPEFNPGEFASFCAQHTAPQREAYQAFLDSFDDTRQQTRTMAISMPKEVTQPTQVPVKPALVPVKPAQVPVKPAPKPLPAAERAELAVANRDKVSQPANRGFVHSLPPIEGARAAQIPESGGILSTNLLKPALVFCAVVLVCLPFLGLRLLRHSRSLHEVAQGGRAGAPALLGHLHLVTHETDYSLEVNGNKVLVEDGIAVVPANRELAVKIKKEGYEEIETITQVMPGEDLDLPIEFRKLASLDDGDSSAPK